MKSFLKFSLNFLVLVTLFSSCQKDVEQLPKPNLKPPSADAGPSQNVALPISTGTLNGAGISYNGPITGYLWSLISGPNVPSILSPSSKTTNVTGLIVGTYKFQFMVIDSAGLTGVDTTSLVVIPNPKPIQNLTIQTGNNPNEALLSWTNSGSTTGANFIFQEIPAGAWTTGGELLLLRSIFKFDLSAIPANATIVSAKLTLYSNPTPLNGSATDANYGPNNAMFIERITSDWNTSITWPTQPFGDNTTQIAIPHTSLPFLDLVDVDVTSMVATMVNGNSNYGFKIRLQNEAFYNIRNFCSSKHANTAKRPKLVVSYQ